MQHNAGAATFCGDHAEYRNVTVRGNRIKLFATVISRKPDRTGAAHLPG